MSEKRVGRPKSNVKQESATVRLTFESLKGFDKAAEEQHLARATLLKKWLLESLDRYLERKKDDK